jgi:N-terminal acetyltransferase B complex non-catalytic subunit
MQQDPEAHIVEALATSSLKLYRIAAEMQDETTPDIACVAVMSLLRLHILHLESALSTPPQLQAAMLLRHLLSNEALRNSRQLALVSTRVHLNLGLGTIAFEHYSYAKIKEMLNDTTAWVLLSRISQSHPFDARGPRGFSADEELVKVIASIEKMEARTGDFLYKDLQDFGFDTAFDLIDFKRKARSSLTKHACMIERRRIARLHGKTVDRQLDLDMKGTSDAISLNNYQTPPGSSS